MPRPRSSAALAIAEPTASLTPERERLAGALARVQEFEIKIDEETSARDDANGRLDQAWEAVAKAHGDEFYARPIEERIPHRLNEAQAKLISDRQGTVPLPIEEARQLLTSARNEHARVEREVTWRDENIRDLQAKLADARRSVSGAAARALSSDEAFFDLVKEARRRAAAYHDVAAALQLLAERGVVSVATKGWDDRLPRTAPDYPMLVAWAEALDGLNSDPAAPLPTDGARP